MFIVMEFELVEYDITFLYISNVVAHQPADLDSRHQHYRPSNESSKRDPADKCQPGHGNMEAVGRLRGH